MGNFGVRGGRVVATIRVSEKELPVVFGREVILVAAIVGVGVGGRRATETVQRNGPLVLRQNCAQVAGEVDVFLIGLPGLAGGLEQAAEVCRVLVGAARVLVRVIIVQHTEVAAGFLPNVVGLRWVDAWVITRWCSQDVMVSAGVGNLSSVRISGGNKAVQIRGSGIVKDLLGRTRVAARLREIVVLQVYDEDVADACGYRWPCG